MPVIKRGTRSAFCAGLMLLMAGCATSPSKTSDNEQGSRWNSNRSGDVSSVNAISGELARAKRESVVRPVVAVPDAVTSALVPEFAPSQGLKPVEERFDLVVDAVPATQFFRDLVRGTRYNVVVAPGVDPLIGMELNQVTVPEVVALVCETYGLVYHQEGALYRVMPGGLRSEVFQINYLNVSRRGDSSTTVSSGQVTRSGNAGSTTGGSVAASRGSSSNGTTITTSNELNFWADLKDTLTSIVGAENGRNVVTNPYSGIVVVKAMPDELQMVREVLQKADLIMQRQVILEAKILEVTLSEGYEQGIEWSAISKIGNGKKADGSQESFITNGLAARDITNTSLEGVFSAALTLDDFTGVIQLLGTQGNVQVLSSPRISTVNNQKAVIKVGTDEFFVTDIDVSDNTASSTTGTSSSTDVELTPFFSGISLDVTPQIGDDGVIILHVHPSISEVQDQTKVVALGDRSLTLPLALSTIRETDSVISAENGQIVVIGGLIQNANEEGQASTPILGDIPVLGELFKQKKQAGTKSELVILLKPVITTRDTFRKDLESSQNRMKTLEEMLSSPPKPRFW